MDPENLCSMKRQAAMVYNVTFCNQINAVSEWH